MGKVSTDGFELDFPNAIEVYEFDSQDVNYPYYHGFTAMKAVDVVAEFQNEYLLIELKNYYNKVKNTIVAPKADVIEDLKYKVRDSYLFQYCHGKVNKPIIYICLLEHLDSALMVHLSKELGKKIPDERNLPAGWLKSFVKSTFVVDIHLWNSTSLSKWGNVKII